MGERKMIGVTIFARMEGSEILNDLGSFRVIADVEPQNEQTRRPGDAPEAKVRATFGLSAELRKLADRLDGVQS
ncbi:hypothetical protein SEA_RUBYRALPH_66 [Microbacterium phage RubyRalph]|nr:hypothetical protein SEA_RUBYRALPH_66 [Microbacterium phage RubyRalph]